MELINPLKTNIAEIDKQHDFFVTLVNDLDCLIEQKCEDKKIEDLVTEISRYAKKHFLTEESYFSKYNYPHSHEHELQHIEMISKLDIFYDGTIYGKMNIKDFQLFLKEWFEEHLKKHDKKYTDYFKKLKIKELKNN